MKTLAMWKEKAKDVLRKYVRIKQGQNVWMFMRFLS